MSDEIIDASEVRGRNHDRDSEIMLRVLDGERYSDIADDFGVTAATISNVAIRNGYFRRPELSSRQTILD